MVTLRPEILRGIFSKKIGSKITLTMFRNATFPPFYTLYHYPSKRLSHLAITAACLLRSGKAQQLTLLILSKTKVRPVDNGYSQKSAIINLKRL